MKHQKSVLYLGFDTKHFTTNKPVIHMPLIEVVPRSSDSLEIRKIFSELLSYSHIVFMSKKSVKIFISYLKQFGYTINVLKKIHIVAIGQVTAQHLRDAGVIPDYISSDETQEGIIKTIAHFDLEDAKILLPRSSSARPLLSHYLVEHGIRHQICTMYDICKKPPQKLIDLNRVDEVIFTTPLAVDYFFELYKNIPKEIKFHPLGPVARERLRTVLHVRRGSSGSSLDQKTTALAC